MQPIPFGQPLGIPGQVNRMMNQGIPAMDQQTTNSPGFNPGMIPPANTPMPQRSPMAQFTQGLAQQPSPAQPQAPQPGQPNQAGSPAPAPGMNPLELRRDLIIRALTNHLASLDKIMGKGEKARG